MTDLELHSDALAEEKEEEEEQASDGFNYAPQMDRGWSWIVMIASFCSNLLTDGITFCSGLVLSELVVTFHESVSKTAWVSSLQSGISMLAGPLSATLTNRLGFRRVIILGSFISSIGLTTSFLATSVETLFATTGIITGLGFCMVYTPSVVAINFYFDRKKALATGIALCGSGVGMFIFAPLTTWLINRYGVRGTFLILGGIYLNCAVFGALIRPVNMSMKRSVEEKKKDSGFQSHVSLNWVKTETKAMSQLSLFKSPSFILICISSFVDALAFYTPHMFLAAYAVGIGMSKESASFLISILGISNSIGRIAFGWLADQSWTSVLFLNNASLTIAGLLTVLVPLLRTYEMLITYSVLLGFIIACPVVTRPILLAELLGLENVNNAFGLILLSYGISGIIGIPLAGLMYDTYCDYSATFYFSGCVLVLAGAICYPLGYVNRWEKKNKVNYRQMEKSDTDV